MHRLLDYQLRKATAADGSIDVPLLLKLVEQSYDETDRDRRLNDRATKLMEEELKAANDHTKRRGEQRLIEALEGAPSAMVLLSPALTVQNVNSAMVAICVGLDAPPRLNDNFRDVLARLTPEIAADRLAQSLFRGESVELKIGGKWYLSASRQLSDGSCAVAFSDVSALKEREVALAVARDAAESANRLKSRFLSTMSHELRTPLNAILGFSEIIRERSFGTNDFAIERYADYADSIHTSGRHLLELISDVLDLSRIEAGSYELTIEQAELSDLVEDTLCLVRAQAEKRNVKLGAFKAPGRVVIEADRRAVRQMIGNLVSNAVKFSAHGGEVEVSAEDAGDHIVLCVSDTGVGISRDDISAVFEPFHQVDAKIARRCEGTGLGLAVTRGLAEMHGGTIQLESELGHGTRAILRLPKHHAQNFQIEHAA